MRPIFSRSPAEEFARFTRCKCTAVGIALRRDARLLATAQRNGEGARAPAAGARLKTRKTRAHARFYGVHLEHVLCNIHSNGRKLHFEPSGLSVKIFMIFPSLTLRCRRPVRVYFHS